MNIDTRNILYDMKKINTGIEAELNRNMADIGLTASQGHILIYILKYAGGCTNATKIHQELAISRATVSGLLKKLRLKGYIEFRDNGEDERLKMITVTPAGVELKGKLDANFQQTVMLLYEGFSKQDLKKLDQLQKKILNNLNQLSGKRRLKQ